MVFGTAYTSFLLNNKGAGMMAMKHIFSAFNLKGSSVMICEK